MAITIYQTPDFGASMSYPMYHNVGSSNSASQDFRYVFDVYIDGNLVYRGKVLDDAGKGLFDAAPIVRAYRSAYFRPRVTTPPVVINADEIFVEYTIQYGEEYTTGSVTTTYTNLSSGTYRGWNAYNKFFPIGSPDAPLAPFTHNWLTERDITKVEMPASGHMYLSYFNASTAENLRLQYQLLDSDYNPNGPVFTSTGSALSYSEALIVFDLNRVVLNSVFTVVGIVNGGPGYQIRIRREITGAPVTPWIQVRTVCESKRKAYPIHFLNRLGGFDTFYFRGVGRIEVDMERQTLRRLPQISGFNQIKEYNQQTNVYGDGPVAYATDQTATLTLQSGYLNDTDHAWLCQLMASPQVYYEKDGYYFPVIIKTDKWSEKFTTVDKMYNLELQVVIGRQIQSQFR